MTGRGVGGSDENAILVNENIKKVKIKKRQAAVEANTREAKT